MAFLETLLKCQKAYDAENYPMQFQELSAVIQNLSGSNQAQFFEDAITASRQTRSSDIIKSITIVQLTNFVSSNDAASYMMNGQPYMRLIQVVSEFIDLSIILTEILNVMSQLPELESKFKEFQSFVQRTLVPQQMGIVYPRLCERCGEMSYLRHQCRPAKDMSGQEYFRDCWKTEEQWKLNNLGYRFE